MTEIIPFKFGMILGRTVNIQNNSIGLDIFSELTTTTIECPSKTISCEAIQSSADVNNVLDISSDMSLKIKAGHLNMEGIGTYIKEERVDNTLEIMLRAHVKTMSETLTNSQPKNGWKSRGVTHYIRSIVYGGDLVARICTKSTDPRIIEVIKGNVKAAFLTDGQISSNTEVRRNRNTHLSEMNISYYSTTLEGEIPTDLGGLLKALMQFTSEVKKINGGKGSPLMCELVPLNQLDSSIPVISNIRGIMTKLGPFEEKYDDTRDAEKMLKKFEEDNLASFTDKQNERCMNIQQRIGRVLEHFTDFIANMDLTQTKTASKLEHAANVYQENIRRIGFQAEVRQFIHEVEASRTAAFDLTAWKAFIFAALASLGILLVKNHH
ncbi:hypothetical protein ACJMK2_032982 [Sinanodonta woodiana]|uniref:Uncharacterized protein n=1 Tax=Sinanodonta woodiana TaxID=1069815 RepID=A0ABD3X413_SINWO